ncbi:MAG: antibiotic biosynthesis monooxygenase [Deltaproteobacteria bacterium]|uniref:Antibiotic biosynthesis monooxygenase n=1 Tax=Candidatus Zymogenus saltonus TaxID=2844893 RepID=A0A9D8KBA9_9DELT|nr:antibiotic biosynthesis monooxygenase [Candidatus Zymogenus saltonus]
MIVVAKMRAKEGSEEKLKDALVDMVSKVNEEEGTLLYTISRSQSDPKEFLISEKYVDMDAFVHHTSTPHFKELSASLASILDGAPEVGMYDELAALDK